jgi:hypothetical protein
MRVTDHAVLRYLERAKGFDLEAVRSHIETLCAQPMAVGAICVKAEGVKFEIDPHTRTVVTCTPGNNGVSMTKRAKFAARCQQHSVVGEGEYT